MLRKIIAILLAGGGSAAASTVAFNEIFGEGGLSVDALLKASEQVGASGAGAILLPVVFYFLSGVKSYFTSVLILTVAAVAGLLYLGVEMPLEQLATVAGIGSAVAVGVYRIIT